MSPISRRQRWPLVFISFETRQWIPQGRGWLCDMRAVWDYPRGVRSFQKKTSYATTTVALLSLGKMSIYLVREVTGNQKAHAHLEARGMEAKSVAATSLAPFGLPDMPQLAYHVYTRLLPAFMLATKSDEIVSTSRPGYNLVDKVSNCVPIPYPPLAVTFKTSLTAEEQEDLKGRGASVIPAKKAEDTIYSFSGSSVDAVLLTHLHDHQKTVKTTNPTPVGAVNLQALQGFFKAVIIVTWFLKTHTYPAFSGPIPDDSLLGGAFDTIDGLMGGKRKGTFGERNAKKAKGDDVDMEAKEFEPMEDLFLGDSRDHTPFAKPSTPPVAIYGSVADLPTLPGNCFPFFDDMMDNDYNFVAEVIRNSFIECLGDTRDEIFSNFKILKGSMGAVAPTKAGRILQHIFVGIKLAIETQGRLFLLMDKQKYFGFSLHGWYYSMSIDGYRQRPKEYTELLSQVRLVDEHSVALAKILDKLSKMKLLDGKKVTKRAVQEIKDEASANPRVLAGFIRKFDLETSEKEEIEKLSNMLSFPQRFWPFDEKRILEAVDLLLSGEFPPAVEPMYARGGVLTSSNVALSVFALFGESGFSFRTAGGRAMGVPDTKESDEVYKSYKGKGGKEVKPNPTIVIAKKSHGLCLQDWKDFLADKTFLNKITRDSAFRSVAFGGDRGKSFWYGLIERIGPLAEATIDKLHADAVQLGQDDDAISDAEESYLDFL